MSNQALVMPAASHASALLGRQPIYDRNRNIYGWELLFRSSKANSADVIDGNAATAEVVLNALHGGLGSIPSSQPLFVNCTREVLFLEPVMPPDRCVLEILETVEFDAEVLSRMKQLRAMGYKLALDDFLFREDLRPAVALADFIKVDVLALSEPELRAHTKILKKYPVTLLAEKIDSKEQMALCVRLGFSLFQGYYLKKPEVLCGKRLKSNRLAALQVLLECRKSDTSVSQIAKAVSSDVSVTHNLLRLANSVMFGNRAEIQSISQAVCRLGTEFVVRWATFLALASDKGCPPGYLQYALQRAHMCALLGSRKKAGVEDMCFLVGMLSVLDSMFDMPLSAILDELPVSAEVREAVLEKTGDTGELLSAVLAYEAGDWKAALACQCDEALLAESYWRSIAYTASTMQMLA